MVENAVPAKPQPIPVATGPRLGLRRVDPTDVVITLLVGLIIFVMIYPVWNLLAVSFSAPLAVETGQVGLFPRDFTIANYMRILNHPRFYSGYRNTIVYTVTGTLVSMVMTTLAAYPLSKRNLRGRKTYMKFIVFIMLFHGGLIPRYLVIRNLGLINSIWAIILPVAIIPWNMIIMRTFFQSIPDSLEEAAEIDGYSPYQILIRVVLPLSAPILATLSLFYAVFYWNDWFRALIYLNDASKHPITLFLRNIVLGVTLAIERGEQVDESGLDGMTGDGIRTATMAVVLVPIMCVYPFLQKHFVKGILVGSLKG